MAGAEFKVGEWLIRPSLNEISRRGNTRHLRRQLTDLLVFLAKRAGQVVSKDDILAAIWEKEFVAESVLPRCIAELRESLSDDPRAPTFIETIPKRGYRLIAPVVDPAETPVRTTQPSVLVLPFRDLSKNQDQQYFCDGLAEQIISALTRIRGLRVIARTSAFLLRDESSASPRIRERVWADMILEGSVSKAGERIRVVVQLVDSRSQAYVWSESYRRSAVDIFDVQDEITLTIAEKLSVELLAYERNGVLQRFTDDVEAHRWYLKGLHYWNQRSREGMHLCRQCLERAIEQDPGYALPYVALADFFSISGFYGFLPPDESFPEAHQLLGRALAIDSGFAAAHASLGFVTFLYDWDWAASRRCFTQALALHPNHSTTNVWYALCLSWAGEAGEAMDHAERASLCDPISPLVGATMGVLLYQQRQYGGAIEQFRRVLQTHPDYTLAHSHIARALIMDGQYEQAAFHATTASGLGMPFAGAFAAFASARAGDPGKAETTIQELLKASRQKYRSPLLMAYLYVALGDRANALRWFGEAKRIRDPLLCQARADPLLNEFRSAPELQAT